MREVQPTISFTLSHLEGKEIEESSFKSKNLKCFEIEYKATGHTALEILASVKDMRKALEVVDLHASYKRGLIIFHILTAQKTEKVEEYVQKKGQFYYTFYSVQRKKKSISRWLGNKEQINQQFNTSVKIQKFVNSLSQNQYMLKELVLN